MGQIRYPGDGAKLTQVALFKQIWLTSTKRSFLTGKWLRSFENTKFFPSLFAHVLPKAQNRYPYYKYLTKNIVLLHPDEHYLLDHGTEEQRINYALDIEEKGGECNWQKLYDLRDELQQEYKEHFPTSLFGIINYKYSPEEVFEKIGMLNKKYFDSLMEGHNGKKEQKSKR